jgi:hypothetical protein
LLASWSTYAVGPVLVASVAGTCASHLLLPNEPVYRLPPYEAKPSHFVFALVFAPLFGVASAGLVRLVKLASDHRAKGAFAIAAPLLVFALLGLASGPLPELLGNGQDVAAEAFANELGIGLLLVLPVARALATTSCLAAGAPGGLFTPSLCIGAVLGSFLGQLWLRAWPGELPGSFAVLGAASFVAGRDGRSTHHGLARPRAHWNEAESRRRARRGSGEPNRPPALFQNNLHGTDRDDALTGTASGTRVTARLAAFPFSRLPHPSRTTIASNGNMNHRLVFTLSLAALGACSTPYAYVPTTNATVPVRGQIAAYYAIPPEAPRGNVQIESYGMTKVTPESAGHAPGDKAPALHLRLVLANNGVTTWIFDTREQRVDLGANGGMVAPAFASADAGSRPPLVTVTPTGNRVADLFFVLPPALQKTDKLPHFDALWRVNTGTEVIAERTPFERLIVAPAYAPAWDYGPGYYWGGPYWMNPAFNPPPGYDTGVDIGGIPNLGPSEPTFAPGENNYQPPPGEPGGE